MLNGWIGVLGLALMIPVVWVSGYRIGHNLGLPGVLVVAGVVLMWIAMTGYPQRAYEAWWVWKICKDTERNASNH